MDDLIDRQAALDAIMGQPPEPHYPSWYAAQIEKLPAVQPDHTADVSKKAEGHEYPPKTRWISCSERLPEPEKKEYWICTDGGYQCQCRWTNTNHFWTDLTVDWHWHIMDVPQYSKVVAWMPLPEPYKQEAEE